MTTKLFMLLSLFSVLTLGCNREVTDQGDLNKDQGLQREEEYKQQDLNTGTLDDSTE